MDSDTQKEGVFVNHVKLVRLTTSAVFAAVLCLISPVTVPLGPSLVPFALQNFAVMFCAVTLDWATAQISVLVYLLLGLFLPIFSGGNTGITAITGVTGGYIWSYLLMVPVIRMCRSIPTKKRWSEYLFSMLGCLIGIVVCYSCGTVQYSIQTNTEISQALSICVLPFIGFDLLKALVATLLGVQLARVVCTLND